MGNKQPAREALATEIRKTLGAKKISRARLARETGMSPTTLGRKIDGEVEFKSSELIDVAVVCGVRASEWIAAYEDAA